MKKWVAGLFLLVFAGCIVVWCVVIEPRWVAHRTFDVSLAEGNALKGLTVAVASD